MDAGTYYLKETKAPAGYIKSTDVYKIEINATYTQIPGGTYTNDDNILVKYDAYEVLDSYSVKVTNLTTNAEVTSNFKITNTGDGIPDNDQKAQSASETDNDAKIANTQGTELPSTGGMGTTILYVGGSILVILAAILLVTKRRMSADE